MKKIIFTCALLSNLMTGIVHADNNDCGNLEITITNLTKEPCTLLSAYLYRGYYAGTQAVPEFIAPGTSAGPIVLKQGMFGPELELTYSCGADSLVTFNSQQNYCMLSAGEVSGQVKQAQNTTADYEAVNGSWFWSQHGSINWSLV